MLDTIYLTIRCYHRSAFLIILIFLLGAAVPPKLFSETGEEKPASKRRRTAADFGSFIKDQTDTRRPPSAEAVSTLREELIQATSHEGWLPPAVYSLDPSRFRSSQSILPPPLPDLPNTVCGLDPELAFSSETTVTTMPLPIAFLPCESFVDATATSFNAEVTSFLSSFPYSASDLDEITRATAGQSNNLEWFRQKYGSLTSSNFGRIIRYVTTRKADPDNIVRDVMNYGAWGKPLPRTNIPSLKHGLRYESVARNHYIKRLAVNHKDISVAETGLHVHQDLPFLRASPDGLVHCTCHGNRLIEIKCPFSARDISVREGIRSKKIKYLNVLPDFSLALKTNSDYYFQVQGAMAITGTSVCDFVVYTKKTMEVIPVTLDVPLWQDIESKLCEFFEVYIVPEILTGRLRTG